MGYRRERRKALDREKSVCQDCGEEDNLHAHHVHPRSEGGSDRAGNLAVVCEDCHHEIHYGDRSSPRDHQSPSDVGREIVDRAHRAGEEMYDEFRGND